MVAPLKFDIDNCACAFTRIRKISSAIAGDDPLFLPGAESIS